MNIEKLYAGLIVNNYKALCDIVGEKFKTGKSKILQLKNFERYFSYEKSGQKFIINEVYEMPKDKEDKRSSGNNNKYCKYIENILLSYLAQCEDNTNVLTNLQWCRLLGLVNNDYGKQKMNELSQVGISESDLSSFYNRAGNIIRRILLSAFKNLSSRKLIKFSEQTILVYKQSGKLCRDIATDYEEEEILNAECHILHNQFKADNIFQIYRSGKQREYYKAVEEYLFDEYGYEYYYKQIKISSVHKELIIQAITDNDVESNKKLLKLNILDYLHKNAKDIYEKSIGTYWELPIGFVDKQNMLANRYINGDCIDASKICQKDGDYEYEFMDLLFPF